MLRRHDLVQVEPAAWDGMLRCYPALLDLPLVADWARRRLAGDRPASRLCRRRTGGAASATLHGKRRLAFSFSIGAEVTELPPVLLCDAARSAPAKWQPIISALLDLGEAIKVPPRVFGALLWEHTTGLPYLSAQSDLDLLWLTSEELTAHSLVERLRQLDEESPVRLDGELELPDGAGVNWRELAHNSDQRGQVLVKTMDGVEVRTKAALFRIPVSLS